MKRLTGVVAVALVLGIVAGCAEKEVIKPVEPLGIQRPQWVTRGSGAFPGDRGKCMYGVGIASKDPNKALQRQAARARGRAELAAQLNTYVAAMMKDFMQSAKDYCDPSANSSIEFVQSVSKNVTDASLFFSTEMDSWEDPSDGTLYCLMMVPIDEVLDQAKEKAKALAQKAREERAEVFKNKTEEALQQLDKEIDKRRKVEGYGG